MERLRKFLNSTIGTMCLTVVIAGAAFGIYNVWQACRWVNQQRIAIEQQQLMQSGANQVIEQIKKQQGK